MPSVLPPAPRPLVARTLGDLLIASAAEYPDADAVVFPQARLSYSDLLAESWRVSRSLSALGVRPRDHVGILMLNTPEFVSCLFGIAMLGAVPVPINARYRSHEIAFLTRDADLVAILTSEVSGDYVDFTELLCEALPGLEESTEPSALDLPDAPKLRAVVAFGTKQAPGFLSRRAFEALSDAADNQQLRVWCEGVPLRAAAAIIYTSGTTSQPRGAILTHEALVRAWMMVGRRWQIGPEDSFWNPCPLFHIAAIGPLIYTLGHGAAYLTDTFFDVSCGLKMIASERATLLYPTYPPITEAMLAHPEFANTDFSSVRAWLNVAPPETLRAMAAAIPNAVQLSTYGSTEGGPVTLHEITDTLEHRVNTCGKPLPGNEVRILPLKGSEKVAPGVAGEIAYRGYNTFSGYYADAEKTAATIDADGWIHTGDLGSIDSDGRLSFLGRLKEMLKVGGENVAPAEVEEFLSTHPAVKLAQVVSMPDNRLNEVVAVFIELHENAAATESELIAFCQGKIASFKIPRAVRFVHEWPMSATKIQRVKLREMLLAELATEPKGTSNE